MYEIGCHIELKLGLLMTKGQLEVDVVCARGIRAEDSPPGKYKSIGQTTLSPNYFKAVFHYHPRILNPFNP